MPACYISESVLERAIVGPAKTLDSATHVNLQYRKNSSAHDPIKKIEKMELIPRCRELNLAFNAISRIENLSPLRQLRVLNLSENRIRSIEGLDQLKLLEVLDLSGNQISTIPSTLGANQNLIHLRLSRNKLSSLDDFHHISSLSNLSKIDVYENPCMKLPHSRLFVIFVLPTIDVLDGESVLISDRQAANERFERSSLNQLQQQLRAVTDLHADSLKKLSEAESQLVADERVLSGLRDQLEKFAQREELQIAHVRDLEAMLQRNAATISKSQARIAELEHEAIKQYPCSRCLSIESGLAAQLATERAARVEAEKQLTEMENVMNHQLKIARGLLAAKSQRFVVEEKLRSMKASEDSTPWKTASQSLLMLCEALQSQLADYSGLARQLQEYERRSDSLASELEALHVKKFQDGACSFAELASFGNARLSGARYPKSQDMIRLRRIISANSRLRAALAAERERNANKQKDWLRESDSEVLQLRNEIARLKRQLVDKSLPKKKAVKNSKSQTEAENDSTLASVFASREKTLLERNTLLETELKHVTSEIDQLRSSYGSESALRNYGNQICQDLFSLQKTRRWALELQSSKSQLEERDAQIRYLIGRLQQQSPSTAIDPVHFQSEPAAFPRSSLDNSNTEYTKSVSPLRNHLQSSGSLANSFAFDAGKLQKYCEDEIELPTTRNRKPGAKRDPFDRSRLMKVIERMKEECNI